MNNLYEMMKMMVATGENLWHHKDWDLEDNSHSL